LKPHSLLFRIVRFLCICIALVLLSVAAIVATSWHCELQNQIQAPTPEPSERKAATAGGKAYSRPEDDTYLSYPEWYIVWSYQEKADFQEKHLPSGFPYFGAARQYWNSYCCIARLIRGKYAFNGGEQLMLVVIGTSFSVEYMLKGIYEKTIGRLSEWSSGGQAVEEDQYAYQVARLYADFVHMRPFYEFDFARQVGGLWSKTPLWGAHLIRKSERKAFLTVAYTFEAFYCWLIQIATHLTYGEEPADTYAWIGNANETLLQQLPRAKIVKQAAPQAFIVDLPRYQEFTAVASELADRNISFVEIAGNSRITVSVLAPQSWQYDRSDAQQLFSAQMLTRPEWKRALLGCDVVSLSGVLETLRTEGIGVEHIYDYWAKRSVILRGTFSDQLRRGACRAGRLRRLPGSIRSARSRLVPGRVSD
jgi:hypothetical protein